MLIVRYICIGIITLFVLVGIYRFGFLVGYNSAMIVMQLQLTQMINKGELVVNRGEK